MINLAEIEELSETEAAPTWGLSLNTDIWETKQIQGMSLRSTLLLHTAPSPAVVPFQVRVVTDVSFQIVD